MSELEKRLIEIIESQHLLLINMYNTIAVSHTLLQNTLLKEYDECMDELVKSTIHSPLT